MWIVGQITSMVWNFRDKSWEEGGCWEFVGVFETEELAIAACKDKNYFVMPTELNKSLPQGIEAEGAYYPLDNKDDD